MHRRASAPAAAACRTAPKSRPVHTRRARRRAARSTSADAATVATRARSGVTSPLPSGCTRFDRNTTNISRQRIDPDRRAGEAGVAERAERQQLAAVGRVRWSRCPSRGRARWDRPARVAGARHLRDGQRRRGSRAPWNAPPPSSMRQKIARSAAVLNSPAWPATPPIRRAVGSWTTPRSICVARPLARPAERRAALGRRDPRAAATRAAGTSCPSCRAARRSCCFANSSSGSPLTRRTMSPSRKKLMSL